MHLPRPLIALAFAGGCVIESTQPATTITARWTLQDLATGTALACPAGFDIARLVATPADGGDPTTTDFPCADGQGVSAALAPMPYALSIEILAGDGTVYGQSLPTTIDLTDGNDEPLAATILEDAGYAHLAWTLVDGTGAMLSCSAGIDTIRITSTSGGMPFFDLRPCGDEAGLTSALPAGAYVFAVLALRQGAPLGPATHAQGTIAGPNRVTDLGSLQLAITQL